MHYNPRPHRARVHAGRRCAFVLRLATTAKSGRFAMPPKFPLITIALRLSQRLSDLPGAQRRGGKLGAVQPCR